MIQHDFPNSKNIARLQYEPDTAEMWVGFRSGAIYKYQDVPYDIVNDFMAAESAGRYFNQNISGFYKESKVGKPA